MRHIAQAALALALLVGLPFFAEAPTSTEGMIAAMVLALVLAAVAIQGIIRYVRSRRPRSYADSMIPPGVTGERKPPTSTKEV